MRLTEWTAKYLVRPRDISLPDLTQRDEAAEEARRRAKADVPDATVSVLSVNRTRGGNLNVEVLRKR